MANEAPVKAAIATKKVLDILEAGLVKSCCRGVEPVAEYNYIRDIFFTLESLYAFIVFHDLFTLLVLIKHYRRDSAKAATSFVLHQ